MSKTLSQHLTYFFMLVCRLHIAHIFFSTQE